MRRGSFTGIASGGGPNEPLIVVEESGGIAEEEEDEDSKPSPAENFSINQYLLTPWRDTRKRSLPTPPCTSGITASQVRRLSERGGEGSGPSPIEQEFLATLSQAPAPQPGARRHSVVTISRAPPTTALFGRNRRESIAAFASGLPGLPLRRDSLVGQSRGSIGGGSNSGSSFNLQLDIMDNITEAKARAKERRKLSRTQSREMPDEKSKQAERSQQKQAAPTLQKRKTSDLLPLNLTSKKTGPGIICSNTDLKNILSPLTSSAQEICGLVERESSGATATSPTQPETALEKKRKQLKDRSNSFDVGFLPGTSAGTGGWFTKRHQPIAKKEEHCEVKSDILVTFNNEKQKSQSSLVANPDRAKPKSPTADRNQVVWDNRSGSVVDPQVLGSAIEVFLNRRSSQDPTSPVPRASPKDSPTKSSSRGWFGAGNEDAPEDDTCDSSICSTLKDLFVK
ncbi:UNVERIFIED_CONTAM: hypothetical protein PYX00_002480 [Menopon gallinae]|uniref:Uncharacterized protein n=1 Tax=Menopon gallinae TaxID=328185 RepID=A0AAW2IHV0_9NEOP